MRIAVDIDGCLNRMPEAIVEVIKREYNIEVPNNIYYIMDTLNFTKEQLDEFWIRHNDEFLNMMDVIPEANENLHKLKQLGCNIVIVTARNYNVAEQTENWLWKHKVLYDDIYFKADPKHDVCLWKNINFMVEDNADYALALAKNNIEVALCDWPYNKDVKHDLITRVKSWGEIYKIVYNKVLNDFD